MCLGILLFLCSKSDIESYRIPNRYMLLTALLSVMRLFEGDDLLTVFEGALPAAVILLIIIPIERMIERKLIGGGDLKLFFVLGLHYRIIDVLIIILISCIIALSVIIFKKHRQGFAFAPLISIGVWIITLVR